MILSKGQYCPPGTLMVSVSKDTFGCHYWGWWIALSSGYKLEVLLNILQGSEIPSPLLASNKAKNWMSRVGPIFKKGEVTLENTAHWYPVSSLLDQAWGKWKNISSSRAHPFDPGIKLAIHLKNLPSSGVLIIEHETVVRVVKELSFLAAWLVFTSRTVKHLLNCATLVTLFTFSGLQSFYYWKADKTSTWSDSSKD